MNKELMDLLYRSFDASLGQDEQARLEEALASDPGLRKEKESLERIRSGIVGSAAKSFNPGFAGRVMAGIHQENKETSERLFESIHLLFRPLAIAASIVIIAMASFNMYKSQSISWESVLVVPEVSIEDAYDPVIALNMER